MANNSHQEQSEEIAEEQEQPEKISEKSEKHEIVLKNRLLILILVVLLSTGVGALFYPVRLNEKSDVKVPLINYIKYKLFVTPRAKPKLQKLPDTPPQSLDEVDKIPDFQCPEGEICADG